MIYAKKKLFPKWTIANLNTFCRVHSILFYVVAKYNDDPTKKKRSKITAATNLNDKFDIQIFIPN